MAYSAQDLLTAIKTYYPYIDTGGNLMNELNRRAGQGATPDQLIHDASGYAEIAGGANKQAQSLYQPAYNIGLNNLNLQGEDLNRQETDINRNYDTLGQTLTDQASSAQKGLEERQNQLGLLSGGQTGAGIGKIQSDLVKNQANSAQDRASNLASLALQRSNLTNQKAQLTNTYTQSVNDAVQKLLEGSQTKLAGTDQNVQANQQKGAELLSSIYQNPLMINNIPDAILKQMLEAYGYTVTD